MTDVGEIVARIRADWSGLDTAVTKSNNKMKKLDGNMKKISSSMKTVFAALTTYIGATTIKMVATTGASLEMLDDKFTSAFRGINAEAETMSKSLAKEFKLANSESKRLLSGTGDLLKGVGMTAEASLDLAGKIQGMSAELAKYNGLQGGVTQATNIFNRAILGERESLTTLGIKILDTDVKQRLFEKGQKDLIGTARLAAVAQATYELALEQSGDAMGATARNAGKLNDRMAENKAIMKELKDGIATNLAPTMNVLLNGINKIVQGFIDWKKAGKDVVGINSDIARSAEKTSIGISKSVIKTNIDTATKSLEKVKKELIVLEKRLANFRVKGFVKLTSIMKLAGITKGQIKTVTDFENAITNLDTKEIEHWNDVFSAVMGNSGKVAKKLENEIEGSKKWIKHYTKDIEKLEEEIKTLEKKEIEIKTSKKMTETFKESFISSIDFIQKEWKKVDLESKGFKIKGFFDDGFLSSMDLIRQAYGGKIPGAKKEIYTKEKTEYRKDLGDVDFTVSSINLISDAYKEKDEIEYKQDLGSSDFTQSSINLISDAYKEKSASFNVGFVEDIAKKIGSIGDGFKGVFDKVKDSLDDVSGVAKDFTNRIKATGDELIEVTGAVGKLAVVYSELFQATISGMTSIGASILEMTGAVGSGIVQMLSGDIVGGLMSIAGESEGFNKAMEKLAPTLGEIAEIAGIILVPVFELLLPFLELFADVLRVVGQATMKVNVFVLKGLKPIMKGFEWLINGIIKMVNKLPFVDIKEVKMMEALDNTINALENSYKELGEETKDTTKEVESLTQSTGNLPTVVKLALERFKALGRERNDTGETGRDEKQSNFEFVLPDISEIVSENVKKILEGAGLESPVIVAVGKEKTEKLYDARNLLNPSTSAGNLSMFEGFEIAPIEIDLSDIDFSIPPLEVKQIEIITQPMEIDLSHLDVLKNIGIIEKTETVPNNYNFDFSNTNFGNSSKNDIERIVKTTLQKSSIASFGVGGRY